MKKPVALVLACGGARGMAHIGVIEELERLNFEIKSIAGCSIGAVIGGIYAAGHLSKFKEWLVKLDKMDVFNLMDLTFSTQGFIKGDKVFNELMPFISDINIEDLPIPFKAVAVDPRKNKEVIFTKGSLFDAIRASVSIPSVLEPYRINGADLVDGGVLNPLPLDLVQRTDNDILVAVNLNALIPYIKPVKISFEELGKEQNYILIKQEINSLWDKIFAKEKEINEKNAKKKDAIENYNAIRLLNHSYDLMQNKITNLYIEKYPPDIYVNISKHICSIFDFYKAAKIIQLGKESFDQALTDYDKRMIEKYKIQT